MKNARAIAASYVGVLAFAGIIFLAAGTLRYWQAWLYVALALVGTTMNHLLVPRGSTLTAERASRAGEGEPWDKRLLGVHLAATLAMFATAGLDSGRRNWTPTPPPGVAVAGAALMLAGQLLFALAKRENPHFYSTVRIEERGHRVCDTGPYRVVRHPGYLGLLLSLLAFPLVLEAWWAFVPASVGVAVLLARTLLEDRFLSARLPGYRDYASRTRWRLVPGVW